MTIASAIPWCCHWWRSRGGGEPLLLVRGCYYVTAAAGSSQHRSATMSLVRGGDRPLLLGRRVQGGGTAAEKEDAGGTWLRGSWRAVRCRLTFAPPPCRASAMAVSYGHQEILQGHSVSIRIAPHGPHAHSCYYLENLQDACCVYIYIFFWNWEYSCLNNIKVYICFAYIYSYHRFILQVLYIIYSHNQ